MMATWTREGSDYCGFIVLRPIHVGHMIGLFVSFGTSSGQAILTWGFSLLYQLSKCIAYVCLAFTGMYLCLNIFGYV
jgi:hypothetical protein